MKKILLLFVLLASSQFTFAQGKHTVTGRVVDDSGRPVLGAEVKLKDGQMSTFTDDNGNYSIEVPDGANVLIVEYVGLGTQEITVPGGSNEANISLSKTESIDGIEVLGVKIDKRSYVGALTTVDAEQIAKRPVTNIAKAIEGAAPGVLVTSGGGQPGATPDILMRGVGSIAANNSPLIVVDGAPYSGSLVSINPTDVETMTFLKDATATALYGSRGANGVIVIVTKKGSDTGKPRINLDASVGVLNRFLPAYETVGAKDYYEIAWQAYQREAGTGNSSEDFVRNYLGGYNAYNVPNSELMIDGKVNPNASPVYTDSWQDELQTTGIRQQYNLSVSNGDSKSDYFFSLGYAKDEGIVKNSEYDRLTTRLTVNSQITNWLKSGISLAGSMDDQRFFVSSNSAFVNPFFTAQMMGSIFPVYRYDAEGNRMYEADGVTPLYDFGINDDNNPAKVPQARPFATNTNVVAALFKDDRTTKALTGFGKTYLEAKFLKDFTLTTNFVYNYYNGTQDNFQNSIYGDASNVRGRLSRSLQTNGVWTWNQYLNWKPSFGPFADKKHNLDVTLVHEAYKENVKSSGLTRIGFVVPDIKEGAAAAVGEGSSSQDDNLTIESYIASLSYNFKNKYYFTANVNRNGTSRFAPQSRWGTFYSVGAGWILSDEEFLKSASSWLDLLKVRGSYGYTGQQDLGAGYYVSQSRYVISHNNNHPGLVFGTIGNDNLKWEKRLEMNVGFDAGFFKNRLNISVDYFNRGSRDMLYPFPLAQSTGVGYKYLNVGDMNNKGLEVAITADIVRSRDFRWNIRANFTHIRNSIIKVQEKDSIISGGRAVVKGLPLNAWYMPRYAGVGADGQAIYYMKDGSTTSDYSQLTVDDYAYAGSPFRDIDASITNTLTYKNFDLTFMFSFGLGGKFYDVTYANLMGQNSQTRGQAWHIDMLNAWKNGDGEKLGKDQVPRASWGDLYQNSLSDRFLVSNSFLNVKSINFGYTLPAKWAKKATMQNARVYVSMDNVFYLSPRKGLDLNQDFFGTSSFTYYPYRTIMFGINLGL